MVADAATRIASQRNALWRSAAQTPRPPCGPRDYNVGHAGADGREESSPVWGGGGRDSDDSARSLQGGMDAEALMRGL